MLAMTEPVNEQPQQINPTSSSADLGTRKIYSKWSHINTDNSFLGNATTNYDDEKGFGYICTTQQARLPADIDNQYFNHIGKHDTSHSWLKIAMCEQPIVAVIRIDPTSDTKGYTKVITFQSTGKTNFTVANSLPLRHLIISKKDWGWGGDHWVQWN